jgi:Ni,Fe-hydrogenase I small subunit
LKKCCFIGVCPHARIIYTFDLVADVSDEGIKALNVGIATGQESLWGNLVSIASPWDNESCEMSVFLMYRHRVVSVPGICHCFLCTLRNTVSEIEKVWNVMSLADRASILWLQVNCPSGITISLASDNHP